MLANMNHPSPTYSYAEVHRVETDDAVITVSMSGGDVEVEVDDRTGSGPVEYVDPESLDTECECESVDDAREDGWEDGWEEAVDKALDLLHDTQDGHWGSSWCCHMEPCLMMRYRLSLGPDRA